MTHSVYDSRRVDVLHAPEYLVDEELHVVVAQLLRLDDVVEVRPHEVRHQVHVGELGQRRGRGEHVQEANDLERREREREERGYYVVGARAKEKCLFL